MNYNLLVVLVVSYFFAPHLAFGQSGVETRTTDKEGGGSQARASAIYGTRHLSPHRKMHFGKRPMVVPPPMIMELREPNLRFLPAVSSSVQRDHNLLDRATGQPLRRFARELPPQEYPVLFTFDLGYGQTLDALPEDLPSLRMLSQQANMDSAHRHSDRGLVDDPRLAKLLASLAWDKNEIQISNNQPDGQLQMSSRLVDSELGTYNEANGSSGQQSETSGNGDVSSSSASAGSSGVGGANNEQAQSSSNSFDDGSLIQQPTINLNTRSIGYPMRPANSLALPSSFFSSLGGSSMGGRVTFNKKAEPKSNWFMHFG